MKPLITTDTLLSAYMNGIFPMAESADSADVFWVNPNMRGIIELDEFHIPKSLKKFIRKKPFKITVDQAFREVMIGCAKCRKDEEDTWINELILNSYQRLHERGFAHSVECWKENELVGGLYGVSINGAFFGESMFSKTTNASKTALCYLVAHLKAQDFKLLDTQFINEHLLQFGCKEIPREEYLKKLDIATRHRVKFYSKSIDLILPETVAP